MDKQESQTLRANFQILSIGSSFWTYEKQKGNLSLRKSVLLDEMLNQRGCSYKGLLLERRPINKVFMMSLEEEVGSI